MTSENNANNSSGNYSENNGYCPKCNSKLYPLDEKYMREFNMCSYCVTYSKTYNKEIVRKDDIKIGDKL